MHILWVALKQLAVGAVGYRRCCLGAGDIPQVATALCAAGTVFVALYNVLGSIFRGVGDSKTPLIIVSVSFVLNFIADMILVGHFKLGAGGSAITNVFAQALSVGLGIRIINRRHLPFPFHKSMIRKESRHLKNIFSVGLPYYFTLIEIPAVL